MAQCSPIDENALTIDN